MKVLAVRSLPLSTEMLEKKRINEKKPERYLEN